jgi:hypothetical protein
MIRSNSVVFPVPAPPISLATVAVMPFSPSHVVRKAHRTADSPSQKFFRTGFRFTENAVFPVFIDNSDPCSEKPIVNTPNDPLIKIAYIPKGI